jgi:hypothetical protein
MSATLGLEVHADRCQHGFHLSLQHPALCQCAEGSDEWTVFTRALRDAARKSDDGLVHQRHTRPLLRDHLEPKRIGLAFRRAIREGLIREVRREQSNDEAGRNTNKWEPVYELRSAA